MAKEQWFAPTIKVYIAYVAKNRQTATDKDSKTCLWKLIIMAEGQKDKKSNARFYYYSLRDDNEVDEVNDDDVIQAEEDDSSCCLVAKIVGVWILAVLYSGLFAVLLAVICDYDYTTTSTRNIYRSYF